MKIRTIFISKNSNYHLIYNTTEPTAIKVFIAEYGKEALSDYTILSRCYTMRDIHRLFPGETNFVVKHHKRSLTIYSNNKKTAIWFIYSPKGYRSDNYFKKYTQKIGDMVIFSTREEARIVRSEGERIGKITWSKHLV